MGYGYSCDATGRTPKVNAETALRKELAACKKQLLESQAREAKLIAVVKAEFEYQDKNYDLPNLDLGKVLHQCRNRDDSPLREDRAAAKRDALEEAANRSHGDMRNWLLKWAQEIDP